MSDLTEATITDIAALVDAHLAAYAEPDVATRAGLIEQVWSVDGRLVDPPLEGTGHAGISEAAAAVVTHFAGHAFRRTTGIDAHHEFVRYGWELVAPDGAVAISGTDIARVASDGRLAGIVGFFGDLPAKEA